MLTSSRVAFGGLAVGLLAALAAPAADEPNRLLKSVTPAGTGVRVRVPVTGGSPQVMQMKAQVPSGKKGSNELIDVTVALDIQPGKSYVPAKTVKSWGYSIKNGQCELPELLLHGSSTSKLPAKAKGGSDVAVRLKGVVLTVVETPAGAADEVYDCTLLLSATALFKGYEKASEPRLAFADRFLEWTAPGAALKWAEASERPIPEATAVGSKALVPAAWPAAPAPGLKAVTVNGHSSYQRGKDPMYPVTASVSSTSNWETGVVLTLGLARGCKVEMDETGNAGTGVGVQAKTEMAPGKIKELRLALDTGRELKTPKYLVLKDVPVVIDKSESEGHMWFGPKFIETYFKDGVYASGPDGVWKLHGRCDPALLDDTKPRKKP